MKRMTALAATVLVAATGFALHARVSRFKVDPDKLLSDVLKTAEVPPMYQATAIVRSRSYGKTTQRELKDVVGVGSVYLDTFLVPRNYTPLVEGTESVAGKPAWILRLRPHHKHFPWKQLWVDKKTFVVLASRDWNCLNTLKRSMNVTSIRYYPGKGPPATAEEWPRGWQPDPGGPRHKPAGFRCRRVETGQTGVTTHRYVDGLYTLTVHISPTSSDPRTRRLTPGQVYDFGQGFMYRTIRGSREILIIADLPEREIKRIAESVR